MKLLSAIFMLWLAAGQLSSFAQGITITRKSSDKEIEAAERKCLAQYGFKADIEVVQRNADGEITNLKCVFYDKSGKQGGSCSSEEFGALVIKEKIGCAIADKGHEKQILM